MTDTDNLIAKPRLNRRKRVKFTDDVVRMFGEGMSVNAISKHVGIDRGCVSRCLKDRGINPGTKANLCS